MAGPSTTDEAPNDGDKKPIAILRFARFFQVYGFALGLIVAALPVGLRWTDFIGYYQSNGSFLTFLASLVAYLSVSLVFGFRHRIGAYAFPARKALSPDDATSRTFFGVVVPTACGFLAIFWLLVYALTLSGSVADVAVNYSYTTQPGNLSLHEVLLVPNVAEPKDRPRRAVGQLFGDPRPEMTVVAQGGYNPVAGTLSSESAVKLDSPAYERILQDTSPQAISYSFWLIVSYVLAFASASVALVWMGMLDYLQDQLGISDASLMRNPYRTVSASQ